MSAVAIRPSDAGIELVIRQDKKQEEIRGMKKLLLSVFQYTIITFEKTG